MAEDWNSGQTTLSWALAINAVDRGAQSSPHNHVRDTSSRAESGWGLPERSQRARREQLGAPWQSTSRKDDFATGPGAACSCHPAKGGPLRELHSEQRRRPSARQAVAEKRSRGTATFHARESTARGIWCQWACGGRVSAWQRAPIDWQK